MEAFIGAFRNAGFTTGDRKSSDVFYMQSPKTQIIWSCNEFSSCELKPDEYLHQFKEPNVRHY